jgi:hypothetical protein
MRALRRVGFVFCLIVCGRAALLKGSPENPCIQLDMDHGNEAQTATSAGRMRGGGERRNGRYTRRADQGLQARRDQVLRDPYPQQGEDRSVHEAALRQAVAEMPGDVRSA